MEGAALPLLLVLRSIFMDLMLGLAFVVIVVLALLYCDARLHVRWLQNEAVRRGHARWAETRDGTVIFRWGAPWVD